MHDVLADYQPFDIKQLATVSLYSTDLDEKIASQTNYMIDYESLNAALESASRSYNIFDDIYDGPPKTVLPPSDFDTPQNTVSNIETFTKFNQQYIEPCLQGYASASENVTPLPPLDPLRIDDHRNELYPVVEQFINSFKVNKNTREQKYKEFDLHTSTSYDNDYLQIINTDNTLVDKISEISGAECITGVPYFEAQNGNAINLYETREMPSATSPESVDRDHKENYTKIDDIQYATYNSEDELNRDTETYRNIQQDTSHMGRSQLNKNVTYKRSYQKSSVDYFDDDSRLSEEIKSPCRTLKCSAVADSDDSTDYYSNRRDSHRIRTKTFEASENNASLKRNKVADKYKQFEGKADDFIEHAQHYDGGYANNILKDDALKVNIKGGDGSTNIGVQDSKKIYQDSKSSSDATEINLPAELDKHDVSISEKNIKDIELDITVDKEHGKDVVKVIKDNCTKFKHINLRDNRSDSPKPSTSKFAEDNEARSEANKQPIKSNEVIKKNLKSAFKPASVEKVAKKLSLKDDKRELESDKSHNKKPSKILQNPDSQKPLQPDKVSYRKGNPRHARSEAYKRYSLDADNEDRADSVSARDTNAKTESRDSSSTDAEYESRKMRKHRMTHRHRYQHQKRVKWKHCRQDKKAVPKHNTNKDK